MTTVVSGELKRTDLCEECAQETGALQPSGFLNEDVFLQKTFEKAGKDTLSCPTCGYTVENLQKTGRLGCQGCYEVFSAFLESAIKESQKAAQHCGKRPSRAFAGLAELESEMKHLISTENFEEAALLRDRIFSKKKEKSPDKKSS